MIYPDSCILIYAVENLELEGRRARLLLGDPQRAFLVTPMVIHECLVGPLREGNAAKRSAYETLFAQFEYADLDLDAYLLAAELRAIAPGLRAPDALHLAGAKLAGCTALWTNDKRLAAASAGLAVDVMTSPPN